MLLEERASGVIVLGQEQTRHPWSNGNGLVRVRKEKGKTGGAGVREGLAHRCKNFHFILESPTECILVAIII